jgi:hypothetical protein
MIGIEFLELSEFEASERFLARRLTEFFAVRNSEKFKVETLKFD